MSSIIAFLACKPRIDRDHWTLDAFTKDNECKWTLGVFIADGPRELDVVRSRVEHLSSEREAGEREQWESGEREREQWEMREKREWEREQWNMRKTGVREEREKEKDKRPRKR